MANAYAAMEHNLTIVPVLNKVDLKHARPDEVMRKWSRCWRSIRPTCCGAAARRASASTSCCEAIVERVPPPTGDPDAPLQAMVFDSHYDEFRGAITYVRVMNGTVRKGQKIRFLKAGTTHEVLELGQFVPAAPRLRRACRPGRSAT